MSHTMCVAGLLRLNDAYLAQCFDDLVFFVFVGPLVPHICSFVASGCPLSFQLTTASLSVVLCLFMDPPNQFVSTFRLNFKGIFASLA